MLTEEKEIISNSNSFFKDECENKKEEMRTRIAANIVCETSLFLCSC